MECVDGELIEHLNQPTKQQQQQQQNQKGNQKVSGKILKCFRLAVYFS